MKTDKIKNIYESFSSKVKLDNTKNYLYIYNGKKIKEELKYEDLVTEKDEEENKVKILILEENGNIKESDEIICPECGENIYIKIKDYKANIYNCKNGHNIDLTINELNNIQKDVVTKIKCNKCKKKNIANIYKNEIYKCLTCNNNLCPSCKSAHDKDHKIIEYDKRNLLCKIHKDLYVKYCNECKKNICLKCIKEHNNHNIIDYEEIIPNNENNNEFKKYIDKLDNLIDDIIKKLINIKDNMRVYYKLSMNIINNNKRNYEILKNKNEFIKANNKIISDIKQIVNEKDINEQFKNLINIYDKINDYNYIKAEINIKEEDLNKDIRIINSFEQYKRDNYISYENDDYKYENEKDIKEKCRITINNKIISFSYFYSFSRVGKYRIIYSFKDKLKNIDYMFAGCENLTNINLANFNSSNIINIGRIFYGCKSLKNINLSNFNTHKTTNMCYMFFGCNSLTNINLFNFNTKNVVDMSFMFFECKSLPNIDLSYFNTKNVTNMNDMFSGCQSLKSVNLTNFDTQNVTNMNNMFYDCNSLIELNLSNFNTQNVIDMGFMFYGCNSLINIDVSSFNTGSVKSMYCMFYGCRSLTNLNLSNFNTQNVTNMCYMFKESNSLINIDLSNFNTENVTNMSDMFSGCESLKEINLSNFNTKNVTNMSYMFSGCKSLTYINLSNFNTQNVTDMGFMFHGCKFLSYINLSNFNTHKVTDMRNMFSKCDYLKKESVITKDNKILNLINRLI